MSAITYREVTKEYGRSAAPAVASVSLEVQAAEFVVLLGPSGCGKTTLLKMTNRLIDATSGTIAVNDQDVRSVKLTELRRHMGYVIQQVGLFPHFTVEANVATVPRLLAWPKGRTQARVEELMELVGLSYAQYRHRYPHQLSGGQQQRIGLARALAADPDILLMDEPFGAIDAITRTRLQQQLLSIQRSVRKTILFVTHDVDEALRLADRIVVMRDGRVLQYDTPLNVLTQPADEFVRELLDTDDVLRELGVIGVSSVMTPAMTLMEHSIGADASLREALSMMLATGSDELSVVDASDVPIGAIRKADVERAASRDSSAMQVDTVAVP